MINGCLVRNNAEPHAYNIIFDDRKPFLVDAQNPLVKDLTCKIVSPYIAPILEIEECYGDFLVPQEWNQGRMYSIF